LQPIPEHPLARAAQADTSGLSRRRQRPSLNDNPPRQTTPALPTESRVTVKPHPVSSLDWGAWQLPASKETRMNQRAQELHLDTPVHAEYKRRVRRHVTVVILALVVLAATVVVGHAAA